MDYGIRDITEKEYRQLPALNYSLLSAFNRSPAHALAPRKSKSIYEFGHAFESILQDVIKGTNTCGERFFQCNATGKIPEDLVGWIENKEDLSTRIVYNKDGETRSGKHKNLHEYIDACIENPGLMPISEADVDMINTMVDNMLTLGINGMSLSNILPKCDFQVPIVWERNGIDKKALLDVVLDLGDEMFLFDIKTTAMLDRFPSQLRSYLWIQKMHYTEGMRELFPDKTIHSLSFLVASKSEDDLNMAQEFDLDPDSHLTAATKYLELCDKYVEWVNNDRPITGWLPKRTVRMWI